MKKNLALYIHIPFCKSKCSYCSFVSFASKKENINSYINVLIKEIELASKKYADKTVDSIFIGGGTPSYLPCGLIKKLMQAVNKNFKVAKLAEISVETNPDCINIKKLEEYKKAGINRISIGFQASNNKLLKLIGRPHTKKEFVSAIKLIKNAGLKNINADIMLGLPNQKLSDIKKAIKLLLRLDLPHISAYDLIVEEGTSLFKSINEGKLKRANENLSIKMYNYVIKKLNNRGLKRYEVSNFAKDGFECKHNLKYWNLENYLGLGLAAHSFIDGVRFENTENLVEYIKNLKNNKLEYKNKLKLSLNDQKQEFIMLGLRKAEGINLDMYKKLFKENLLKKKQNEVEFLLLKGLIGFEGSRLYVKDKGFNLLNIVVLKLTD